MLSVTAPICSIKVWRVTVTLKQDLPALSETETRLGTSLMISDVQKVFLTVMIPLFAAEASSGLS